MRVLKNRVSQVVLIIVMALGLNYVLFQKELPIFLGSDALHYHKIALALEDGSQYYELFNETHDIGWMITPGYPAFIALIYASFGQKALYVVIAQTILSVISLLLFYFLMNAIVKKQMVAFLATFSLLIYYPLWGFNFKLFMEILTIFYIMLGLFVLHKYFIYYKIKFLILASFIFAILIITNVRFVTHLFFTGAFLVVILINNHKNWIKHGLLFAFFMVMVIVGWHVRQYTVFNKFVFFNPGRERIFSYQPVKFPSYDYYINEMTSVNSNMDEIEQKKKDFPPKKYADLKTKYQQRDNFDIVLDRFLAFWQVWNFEYSLRPDKSYRIKEPYSLKKNGINSITLFPLFLLLIPAIYFAIKKKNYFVTIMNIFIISHWLIHTIVHYHERYRLTIIPIIFFVGWYGFYQLVDYYRPLLKKIY